METGWEPTENDVKTVLEAHGLLPAGPLLDESMGLVSMYADRIKLLLDKLPASASRQKAVLAIVEEGLMQEGLIPSKGGRKFEMPAK